MPNIPELPKNAKMRLLKIRILLSKSNLKSQFFIFILIGGISIKNPSWGHQGSISCLFTFSAVCLHFQLFVYFFEFPNKNIVFCKVFCHSRIFKSLIFSYLFTFLSAVCLLFCLHCQLIVYFFNFQAKTLKNHDFFAKNLSLNS